MLAGIEAIEIWTALLRAAGLVAALQAAGMTLFMVLIRTATSSQWQRQVTVWLRTSACMGLLLVASQHFLQAGRMFGEWSGVLDLSLQRLAWFSSAGLAIGVRLLGLLLIVVAPSSRRYLSVAGALLVCGSFVLTGHTAVHPERAWLMMLLALHVGIVAFWLGALLPLYFACRHEPGVAIDLVAQFSRLATRSVPLIGLAGVTMAWRLLPAWENLWQPYGLLLLAKLLGFLLLLALAALNKWRYAPRLQKPAARAALQRTVLSEFALIVMVLAITAVLTSWFSPD